jgi:sucrose phosphorylase
LEGILDREELDGLIEIVKANQGQVSYKQNPDGSESPYELNITYVDAILADTSSTRADKFLASQSIQYALPGVPATYIHSLLGSRNWVEGVKQTGRARTINREKLQVEKLTSELNDPDSFRARVFFPYLNLIKTRKKQSAFHPNAGFNILQIDSKVFGIKRYSKDQTIYALTNISSKPVSISLSGTISIDQATNLITGETVDTAAIDLDPYQYMWLEEKSEKI